MKVLAIIPARSGSKGLKDKNIYLINNRPLMDYTIKAAINSGCFDNVMVSTDSDYYADIAKKCGAEVPFMRSNEMSSDNAESWAVVREVLEMYKINGQFFDYVALLQPTSPLRDSKDIKSAFDLLCDNVNAVVSVCEPPHPIQWCFKLDNSRLMTDFANSPYKNCRRQELEKYYIENGAIYIVDAKKIMDSQYNFYSDYCMAYIMNRSKSVDIDSIEDIYYLNALLSCKE